jgi:spore maturation protein CgeB
LLKIALISDELTYDSLKAEDNVTVYNVTPLNYKVVLKFLKPDFLFVESAWHGYKNRWKYKIASYPDVPKRNNKKLKKVVHYAKKFNVPTIFWNKEDGVHFERFIDSAKFFDHIFTVDANCIEKYKAVVPKKTTVNPLMFAVQEKFHYFDGFHIKYNSVNFVGSYSTHIHSKRRMWQDMMFSSTQETGMNLVVFDRNSNRKSHNYRYPKLKNIKVKNAISYKKTAEIYKKYLLSLNVNTIENSPTMVSRRLLEIIACGGVAITNSSQAVDNYFKEYCYIVQNKEDMIKLLTYFQNGLQEEDYQKLRAGAKYIAKYHTWKHRIQEIKDVIGI